MKKNVASQIVMAQLISKTDGSAVTTGTTLVYVSVDGAPQTLAAGSPSCAHLGQGVWEYVCTAADSNGDHVAFTFVNSSACNVTVQIYTSYPQTGDNYARLGAPAGASVSADIAAAKVDTAAVKAKTDNLPSDPADASDIAGSFTTVNTKLDTIDDFLDTEIAAIKAKTDNLPSDPADASDIAASFATVNTTLGLIKPVTDKLNDTFTSDSSPANYRFSAAALALAPTGGSAPTAADIADAVWDEARAGHVSAGTFGEGVATLLTGVDAIPTNAELATALGTADDAVLAAVATLQTSVDDVPTNAELATALAAADDAVLAQVALVKAKTDNLPADPADASDIAASFSTVNTKLDTIDDFVDTEIAAIKVVTDKLNTTLTSANSPADYVFTAQALAQAPGGSGLTVGAIADAVWDEAIAGHLGAGSTGLALNDATAAGNPWNSVLEGTLTGGDLLRVAASFAAGETTIADNGNGTATVVFRDASDTTDLITGTVVGSARTSVTITP